MSLSNVTVAVASTYALGLSTFLDADDAVWLLWAEEGTNAATRRLSWKRHDLADSTAVAGHANGAFGNFTAAVLADGNLLVVYDDEAGAVVRPNVWAVVFNRTTGVVVAPAKQLFMGARPQLLKLPGAPAGYWAMSYFEPASQQLYIRESYDGGATWTQRRPALNNKVRSTKDLVAYPLDETHITVAQVGEDARDLRELGSFTHSRPLAGIYATGAGEVLVVESVQSQVSSTNQLTDTLRGPLVKGDDGLLWTTTRVRQGITDGNGDLLRLDVTGHQPNRVGSVILPSATTAGKEDALGLNPSTLDVARTVPAVVDLEGSGIVPVALTATEGVLYAAGYTDADDDVGVFSVTAAGDPASVFDGVPVHAVAHAAVGALKVIAVAYYDNDMENVRLYVENGTAPTLKKAHRMPARINALALVMSSATEGTLYVAMADRLDVYAIAGLDQPLQRTGGWTIVSSGSFFEVKVTSRRNVIAALGEGGVGVFAQSGDRFAQLKLSGVYADVWQPGVAYAAGVVVRPSDASVYAPLGKFFTCTQSGTSGTAEPLWNPAPTATTDGGAKWLETAPRDAVVTAVAVDEENNRIYASGVVGGRQAVMGRVWIVEASGWRL